MANEVKVGADGSLEINGKIISRDEVNALVEKLLQDGEVVRGETLSNREAVAVQARRAGEQAADAIMAADQAGLAQSARAFVQAVIAGGHFYLPKHAEGERIPSPKDLAAAGQAAADAVQNHPVVTYHAQVDAAPLRQRSAALAHGLLLKESLLKAAEVVGDFVNGSACHIDKDVRRVAGLLGGVAIDHVRGGLDGALEKELGALGNGK